MQSWPEARTQEIPHLGRQRQTTHRTSPSESPRPRHSPRHNRLEALPCGAAVARAEALVELVLTENSLSALPPEVFSLPALEILEVCRASIDTWPESGREHEPEVRGECRRYIWPESWPRKARI